MKNLIVRVTDEEFRKIKAFRSIVFNRPPKTESEEAAFRQECVVIQELALRLLIRLEEQGDSRGTTTA